jgi:hypothetical protein
VFRGEDVVIARHVPYVDVLDAFTVWHPALPYWEYALPDGASCMEWLDVLYYVELGLANETVR